jgi:hypothetical protein
MGGQAERHGQRRGLHGRRLIAWEIAAAPAAAPTRFHVFVVGLGPGLDFCHDGRESAGEPARAPRFGRAQRVRGQPGPGLPRRGRHKAWARARLSFRLGPRGKEQRMSGRARDLDDVDQIIEQVRALARFPSENPNPVMRVTVAGRVLYANETAKGIAAPAKPTSTSTAATSPRNARPRGRSRTWPNSRPRTRRRSFASTRMAC